METDNVGPIVRSDARAALSGQESFTRNVGGTGHLAFRDGRDPTGVRVLRS